MKKNLILGLLAAAALLTPVVTTPATYAAGEPDAVFQCTKLFTGSYLYPDGQPPATRYVVDGDYSGDVNLVSWDPTTQYATYRGTLFHRNCR